MRARVRLSVAWAMSAAILLAGCSGENARVRTHLNTVAALRGDLPVNPMQWKVITSGVQSGGAGGVMYTVFGNDAAVASARTNAQPEYPAGAVIALVAWSQQGDPRWFGGRVPGTPTSVEFVTVGAGANGGRTYAYEQYGGKPLRKIAAESGAKPGERASYLLAQRAAVMP